MTLFSIIIPIFNAEKYLKKCVDSVLAQTYKDFELLLIDDGSVDNSLNISIEYQKKDSRVKVHHKKNGGVSSARNIGIDIATGKYLIFVDSDDFINEDMLYDLSCALNKHPEIDYLVSGINVLTMKNEELIRTEHITFENKEYNKKTLFEDLEENYRLINISGPWAKVFRRKLIGDDLRFDEEMTIGEDGYFNLSYIDRCNEIYFYNRTYYNYIRENEQSLFSRYYSNLIEVHEKVYDLMRDIMIENKCSKEANIRFEKLYCNLLLGCIHRDFQNKKVNSSRIRKENISRVVNNQYIKLNVNNYIPNNFKERIMFNLIEKKSTNVLYWLFSLRYF